MSPPALVALRSARTRILEAVIRLETERNHDARPLLETAVEELCVCERILLNAGGEG